MRDHQDREAWRWRPDRDNRRAQNLSKVVEIVADTAQRVAEAVGAGEATLVLGGDCTVGIGTVAGHLTSGERLGLVYFDTHADLNVPSSVREGALDWMGMAHMLGEEGAAPELVNVGTRTPLLEADQVILFAWGSEQARPFERSVIDRRNIEVISVDQVSAGPEQAALRARELLEDRCERLLVHFDVDVIDFTDVPLSENSGRNEGLAYDHALTALQTLMASPRFAGVTITELNPDHTEGAHVASSASSPPSAEALPAHQRSSTASSLSCSRSRDLRFAQKPLLVNIMVRRLVLASLLALLLPPSATAGGWWSSIDTDRSTVAAGQRVEAEADVLFSSVRAAREAQDDPFYVYALRGLDHSVVRRAMSEPYSGDWWSLGDASAVELGRVVLRISEANLGRARASFTLPELTPSTYALMFCDAGCAHPLADVVPTRDFTVVADPATAVIAERAMRLEERLAGLRARSRAAARIAERDARAAAAQTEAELRALDERVRALDLEVALAANSSRPSLWALAGWVLAGGLAGAFAFIVLRRRSAKPTPRFERVAN